jgi:hypothetical protein
VDARTARRLSPRSNPHAGPRRRPGSRAGRSVGISGRRVPLWVQTFGRRPATGAARRGSWTRYSRLVGRAREALSLPRCRHAPPGRGLPAPRPRRYSGGSQTRPHRAPPGARSDHEADRARPHRHPEGLRSSRFLKTLATGRRFLGGFEIPGPPPRRRPLAGPGAPQPVGAQDAVGQLEQWGASTGSAGLGGRSPAGCWAGSTPAITEPLETDRVLAPHKSQGRPYSFPSQVIVATSAGHQSSGSTSLRSRHACASSDQGCRVDGGLRSRTPVEGRGTAPEDAALRPLLGGGRSPRRWQLVDAPSTRRSRTRRLRSRRRGGRDLPAAPAPREKRLSPAERGRRARRSPDR